MLETGITIKHSVEVTENNTAAVVGSGSLPVFATPALAALAEKTSCLLLDGKLEEGTTTVGSLLNIKHLAPTPIGMTVSCECTLSTVDGRRLCFDMSLFDETGKVGEVYHERFIIKAQPFMEKANAKLGHING